MLHCQCEEQSRIYGTKKLIIDAFPAKKRKRDGKYVLGFPDEWMVRADMGFTLDDVEARTPNPLFAQCLRERVRVDERAARRVHKHGTFLHLTQKVRVDDVSGVLAAGSEHKEHVAFARELVELYAPDGAQVGVARSEGRFEGGVEGGGRVGGVDAVREAEGGEAG
jgi:hypothetical protein